MKVFKTGRKKVKAVNNLSLNIYPGQVTAFLGHNGAGKTTVMNMLTGIFPPTSGTVFINGYNIVGDTNAARRNIALCPQHNILYDALTVEDHLKLFAALKGTPASKIRSEVNKLLAQFELENEKNTRSKNLSLGMKRKLSLGNAIIGGSKVLILDEPTTSLDPESRHVIWEIIHKLRNDHTILLSTHCMEEADALGDRIAIIGDGTMQCCGSSLYLKKKFGDGYHLHIEKDIEANVGRITDALLNHVPDAKLLSNTNHEAVFTLSSNTGQFSNLFKSIEESADHLGILSHGLKITTMDDVFMKVGEKLESKRQRQNGDSSFVKQYNNGDVASVSHPKNNNSRLAQQIKALFFKRAHYAKRQILLLMLQALIPLIASI